MPDNRTRSEIRSIASLIANEFGSLEDRIAADAASAKADVKRSADDKIRHRIGQRLASTTIEKLAEGKNLRQEGIRNLRKSGLTTAIDIASLSAAELATTPGIGIDGAKKLVDRAGRLGDQRQDDLIPSAAIDLWDGADRAVVRALKFWFEVSQLIDSGAGRSLNQIVTSARSIRRNSVWYRWMIAGKGKRKGMRGMLITLEEEARGLARSGDFSALSGRLLDLEHHRGVEVDRSYWRRHSTDLLGGLERIYTEVDEPLSSSTIGSLGEVDRNLAARMQETRLDTSLLTRRLRPYQDEGARFCVCVGSGLLGDDMGLGKTTQILAALAHYTSGRLSPVHVIVVCPASLLSGWNGEAAAVCPKLKFWLFRGDKRTFNLNQWKQEGGIIATSFELADKLVQDLEEPRVLDYLIVDEAHYVKEPTARRTKTVQGLSLRSQQVLLMTGTPLVNKPADIINLIRLVDTELAISLDQEFGKSDDILRDAAAFRSALSTRYLRRDQRQVLSELPPLTWIDVPVDLTDREIDEYKLAVSTGNFTTMRQSASAIASKGDQLHRIAGEAMESGRKLLVFSYFLDSLRTAVSQLPSDSCYLVDGSVPGPEADRREAEFKDQAGFAALIYQISKGGYGKNFQDASIVVLMEPQFNPAAEAQAVARAHRMGQIETVICHRLIATGTVDERLVQIGSIKAELVNELTHESDLEKQLARITSSATPATAAEIVREEQHRLGLL